MLSALRSHRSDRPDEWYEIPTFYFTNPHYLIGANDPARAARMCCRLIEVAATPAATAITSRLMRPPITLPGLRSSTTGRLETCKLTKCGLG
jgi:hypothetical protein